MEQDDPEAFRSEVLGLFRAGVSTLLDPDALAAVVEVGIRERAPEDGRKYAGYVDAASGSGKDSFAAGVAHRDGERVVLDCCRRWQPPFNPSGVIAEAADLFGRYRIREVSGDRYAPGFVAENFRANAITYTAAPITTSDAFMELVPVVNAGAVVLLDEPVLLRELRGLERRRGTAGRDKAGHRPGQHDDAATAAAGAIYSAREPASTYDLEKMMEGDPGDDSEADRAAWRRNQLYSHLLRH